MDKKQIIRKMALKGYQDGQNAIKQTGNPKKLITALKKYGKLTAKYSRIYQSLYKIMLKAYNNKGNSDEDFQKFSNAFRKMYEIDVNWRQEKSELGQVMDGYYGGSLFLKKREYPNAFNLLNNYLYIPPTLWNAIKDHYEQVSYIGGRYWERREKGGLRKLGEQVMKMDYVNPAIQQFVRTEFR